MKIVIFEDDDAKFGVIRQAFIDRGISENRIVRIESISEFARLQGMTYDLCVVDIKMPGLTGGERRDAGPEILQMIDIASGSRIPSLVITSYPAEAEVFRDRFASKGCIIYDYFKPELWHSALDAFIAQGKDRGRYDFAIVTAIPEERDAYRKIPGVDATSVERNGFDLWDFEFGGRNGTVLLLPKMGLVNCAVTVARFLENYSPSVIAMTGICGGMGSSKLGQLLVTDLCWEYQSGKWFDQKFQSEPYQCDVPNKTQMSLSKLFERPDFIAELEAGYRGKVRPSVKADPKIVPFASGSAVIASQERLESVKLQHRKVGGIDMEIFGFHRAFELSGNPGQAFSAKTVVDLANKAKNDKIHEYGSYISANFALKAIQALLQDRS